MVCKYGNKGYPYCHCNDCIEKIEEYEGFKKGECYIYDGQLIIIEMFCPFKSCSNILIVNKLKSEKSHKWINLEEAKTKFLKPKRI